MGAGGAEDGVVGLDELVDAVGGEDDGKGEVVGMGVKSGGGGKGVDGGDPREGVDGDGDVGSGLASGHRGGESSGGRRRARTRYVHED